ncbi:Crp/Fnr family transcriptional regulator [Agrilactobacillus composti]|uniref:Crp/Fnr family transcriptional regulator n=1 Tax=Agrilactobacillus composti TaxID=398555 RepID=UPI000558A9BA|nr:Crp/Fnr family transcriptional regulator [Agrilactobacillus composti]
MTQDTTKATTHVCAELVPIFTNLDQSELLQISDLIHHHHFEKGSMLLDPDSQDLVIVRSGQVKVYQLNVDGKEQLLRVLVTGDYVGEGALFGVTMHDTYAQAITPGAACVITRADFEQLLLDYPAISLKLLAESAAKIAALEKQTALLSSGSIQERLMGYFNELAAVNGSSDFEIPMQRKALSSFLGTTPETLSRMLKKLKEGGLIDYKGRQVHLYV